MWVDVCTRSCPCVWLFVTHNAAGPHSPSGMWDFQIQNRPSRGRSAGTNGRERRRREGDVERGRRETFSLTAAAAAAAASYLCPPRRCVQSEHLSEGTGKFLWLTETGAVTV